MTTHDKDKIIAAAKECFDCYEDGRGRLEYSADEYGIERFYAIAFEHGRQAEREECAILVEDSDSDGPDPRDLADAIRARSTK